MISTPQQAIPLAIIVHLVGTSRGIFGTWQMVTFQIYANVENRGFSLALLFSGSMFRRRQELAQHADSMLADTAASEKRPCARDPERSLEPFRNLSTAT